MTRKEQSECIYRDYRRAINPNLNCNVIISITIVGFDSGHTPRIGLESACEEFIDNTAFPK